MMLTYAAATWMILMLGSRSLALLFVAPSEVEILDYTEQFFAYFLLVLPGCRATVHLALRDTRGRFQQPCDALGCFRDDRTYLGELVCGSRFWILRRLLR